MLIVSMERLQELGHELSALRREVGWSGNGLAIRAGVSQPTVSRVENGQRVASVDAVVRIVDALPISATHAEALRFKARQVYASAVERRVDAGYSFVAETVRKLERDASEVRGFQSAAIPRLLRTVEYTHAAGTRTFGGAGLLSGPGRAFHFLITEGALRTWPGSRTLMPSQLDHLLSLVDRPNVRIGLIPWSRELPVFPLHGFTLYDAAVSVETFTAELTITEPEEVRAYGVAFELLQDVAVYGDDARALLAEVRGDFG